MHCLRLIALYFIRLHSEGRESFLANRLGHHFLMLSLLGRVAEPCDNSDMLILISLVIVISSSPLNKISLRV